MNQLIQDALVNLRKANTSLHAALAATPRNAILVSAIIKNFEFNYELAWKAMRRLLSYHGVPTSSPRQAIAESFRKGFIDSETTWLGMIEDRNLTVHTYDEAFAAEMANRIEQKYLPLFDAVLRQLNDEASKG
jgi:nucleotidyltransferase substrate binding protein (TIGR01987 family)